MLKLKLKPKDGAPSDAPSTNEAGAPPDVPTPASATVPKLKFKSFAASSAAPADGDASTEPPKQKRKYVRKPKFDEKGNEISPAKPGPKPGSKKRAREDNGDMADGSPATKRKPKPTAKSLALTQNSEDDDDDETDMIQVVPSVAPAARPLAPLRTQSLKISIKPKTGDGQPPPQPGIQRAPTLVRIKGKGKVPYRPPGVGYDSEADEAEDDPAIESQFVLRMQPGPDCDLLRKAIEEKKIGLPASKGGPGISMRFFDKEGRRATITIRENMYAAAMVDLPCVVESMKSWNKKDWVKTADVCQMLLVLGKVNDEEEAKRFPLPREVDSSSHQYAHGLTPPMHWVRKRRFRHRVSYRRIEEVESIVEELLAADREAIRGGGSSDYQVLEADRVDDSEDSSENEVDQMEGVKGGEDAGAETPVLEVDEGAMDEDDLEQMMLAGLAEAGDGDVDAEGDVDDLFDGGQVQVEVETPAMAHAVAAHLLGDQNVPLVESPVEETSTPGEDSPDEDDDEDDDEDGSQDEEAKEALAQQESLRDDIQALEKEKEDALVKSKHPNVLFKKRALAQIERLNEDIELKKGTLSKLQGREAD
ncbi:hypothetical protein EJ04DRAFT_355490 [Polyplosphaeria fusca]|uniref:TAFII55 protein conserved region domain-containing protein n=1 Tax=Polyplosphaeria fusca TaxID=682080 RepID=A0A9P4R9D3_9PLEO|nr:hypothetical protein EJ04DRAFT_355490 [Polyplosphaeria fusca]